MYVRTYVRGTYVPEDVTLRNVDRNVAGFLPADLLRGLDGARTTTLRNRSVDERAVLQGLQSWNSYT